MIKPELLAPAGNFDCMVAAIAAGCDAVYLAGKHYGARNYAGNFTDLELVEAIKYAHRFGVKVYVTINTLIYDSEVDNFIDYVRFLAMNNVDAIIVQDIGMMHLIHTKFPNLAIHASTQMHIHNVEGLKLVKSLGVKRAVVARETNILELKKMTKVGIDLEVFVHGALCICYSGQCLMSSLIGGRSGNRGTCAQCCRQKYSLMHDNNIIASDKYLLSTKDLYTIENIGSLIDIGVQSFKIEGRMKRAEYVYYVVSLYRKAIDSYLKNKKIVITDEELYNLKKLFNRDFTKGFLFNEENDNFVNELRPNHMGVPIGEVIGYNDGLAKIKLTDDLSVKDGIRVLGKYDVGTVIANMFLGKQKIKSAHSGEIILIPLDPVKVHSQVLKTTDEEQIENIKSQILAKKRKINITGSVVLKNNRLILNITDGKNKVSIKSNKVEESINQPTTQDRIYQQLTKLGDTIYAFNRLDIDIDDNIFIPIADVNAMRREAVDKLNQLREYSIEFKECDYKLDVPNFRKEKKLNIYITNKTECDLIKDSKFSNVYMDYDLYNEVSDRRKVLKLDRVITDFKEFDCNMLVGELGSVYKYKNVITDFSLNVTNAYSVGLLHSLGVKKVTLSYEMNNYQIKKLVDNYREIYGKNPNLELIIEANEEVMVSKYNILKKYKLENGENYLVDRFNNKYKIVTKNGLMYIYNYERRKLDNMSAYYSMGINSLRINL